MSSARIITLTIGADAESPIGECAASPPAISFAIEHLASECARLLEVPRSQVTVTVEQRPASQLATRIVNAIVADLSDRRGLRQQWDQIDEDDLHDIVAEWEHIVDEEMSK